MSRRAHPALATRLDDDATEAGKRAVEVVEDLSEQFSKEREAAIEQFFEGLEVEREAAIEQLVERVEVQRGATIEQLFERVEAEREAAIDQFFERVEVEREAFFDRLDFELAATEGRLGLEALIDRLFWRGLVLAFAVGAIVLMVLAANRLIARRSRAAAG